MGKKNKKKNRKSLLLILLFFAGISIFLYRAYGTLQQDNKTDIKVLPTEIKKELQETSVPVTYRIPILLYHYVEYVTDKNDTIRQSLAIYPSVFEKQIQTLKDTGFTFMTARELGEVLDGKRKLPKKPILLTFDDGYRDFYTDVFPLLKKHKVKATAYIVPGFLDKQNYLFMSQLKEIAENGLVDIGAHTMHHMNLKGEYLLEEKVVYEIEESKRFLEERLHIPIVSFAYPYGALDKQAIDIVEKAGFTTAVSTVPGIEVSLANRFFIFRIRPGGRYGDTLLRYLEQSSFNPY